MMGGVKSNDLWLNCEQSSAGTLTIGGIVIRKHTKRSLSWPAEKDVLRFSRNYLPLFRHLSKKAGKPISIGGTIELEDRRK